MEEEETNPLIVFSDFVTDANESSGVDEHDGFVFVGLIAFDMFPGAITSVALDILVGRDIQLPAIYECCVGNKTYCTQKYVLGSCQETKKKIVHTQSLYIL